MTAAPHNQQLYLDIEISPYVNQREASIPEPLDSMVFEAGDLRMGQWLLILRVGSLPNERAPASQMHS